VDNAREDHSGVAAVERRGARNVERSGSGDRAAGPLDAAARRNRGVEGLRAADEFDGRRAAERCAAVERVAAAEGDRLRSRAGDERSTMRAAAGKSETA